MQHTFLRIQCWKKIGIFNKCKLRFYDVLCIRNYCGLRLCILRHKLLPFLTFLTFLFKFFSRKRFFKTIWIYIKNSKSRLIWTIFTYNSFAILTNIESPAVRILCKLFTFSIDLPYTETPASRTIYKTLFTNSFLIWANPTQIYSITFNFLKIKQFCFLLVFSLVPFVNWDMKDIL